MKRIGLFFIVLFLVSCVAKQHTKPYVMVDGSSSVELEKANFTVLKNFLYDELDEAIPTFKKTCEAIKENTDVLSEAQININAEQYIKICEKFESEKIELSSDMRQFLIENFDPYLVKQHQTSQGKFTSYYEAELQASKTRHDQYIYPIYNRPDDLIEINLTDFDKTLPNKRILGRLKGSKLIPYYTRSEIENNGLNAPIILWGNDAVDIYLMQIQGSAVALLDDGTSVRIRYADNNGHSFVGIGSILLKKGLLKSGQASMDKIRDWLKQNPDIAMVNMSENPRYIFHKISDADGPIGALGVSLTAGRSLAVDNTFIPLGSLLWIETVGPDNEKIEKLVIAQDIGGAIKGAIRGDYFWGHGEQALLSAGKMNSSGQYYILLPK
ncbi:MAG: murein transglycosylase A [Alphaproteobacteria bacterium]|nr:murein transglycosylase A [Alphaproteobacteria bacterium]